MLPVHLEQDNQNTPEVLLLTAWWLDSEGEQIRWARGSCHLLGPSLQSPMGSLPLRGPAQSEGRQAPSQDTWGAKVAASRSRPGGGARMEPDGPEPPVATPPAWPPCPRAPPGLWVSLWPLLSGTDARGGRLDGAAARRMAERGLTGQPQDARAWQAGLGATAAEALCGLILFLEPSNHPAAPAAREVDCPRSQARHPPSPAAEPSESPGLPHHPSRRDSGTFAGLAVCCDS